MMRVLFVTTAIASHLNLMVPSAWSLRSAGHEVRVASQPNLTPAVTAAGLTAVPVGDALDTAGQTFLMRSAPGRAAVRPARLDLDISEDRRDRLDLETVSATLTVFPRAVSTFLSDDAMLDDLVRYAGDWQPDLVVWDALTYAGPIAAAACGAEHVRSLFGPDYLGRMRRTFHGLAAERGGDVPDPLRRWLGPRAERHGCEFDEDMVLGRHTLDPLPPWLAVDTGREPLRVRHVPYCGAAVEEPWMGSRPDRPRVCVTLGTTAHEFGLGDTTLRELVDAVAELDVEVVVTATAAELGPGLPANVRAAGFAPLDALLPTCSAIVHHFGVGTLGVATYHAVPQVRVSDGPGLWGESDIATRLVSRGAGRDVGDGPATPAGVRDAVACVLGDPAVREAAERIRAELRAVPAPGALVGELERLARPSRTDAAVGTLR